MATSLPKVVFLLAVAFVASETTEKTCPAGASCSDQVIQMQVGVKMQSSNDGDDILDAPSPADPQGPTDAAMGPNGMDHGLEKLSRGNDEPALMDQGAMDQPLPATGYDFSKTDIITKMAALKGYQNKLEDMEKRIKLMEELGPTSNIGPTLNTHSIGKSMSLIHALDKFMSTSGIENRAKIFEASFQGPLPPTCTLTIKLKALQPFKWALADLERRADMLRRSSGYHFFRSIYYSPNHLEKGIENTIKDLQKITDSRGMGLFLETGSASTGHPYDNAKPSFVDPEVSRSLAFLSGMETTVEKMERIIDGYDRLLGQEVARRCSTPEVCKAKASAAPAGEGVQWGGEETDTEYPPGCYKNGGGVYFNKGLSTKPYDGSSKPLDACKDPWMETKKRFKATVATMLDTIKEKFQKIVDVSQMS